MFAFVSVFVVNVFVDAIVFLFFVIWFVGVVVYIVHAVGCDSRLLLLCVS